MDGKSHEAEHLRTHQDERPENHGNPFLHRLDRRDDESDHHVIKDPVDPDPMRHERNGVIQSDPQRTPAGEVIVLLNPEIELIDADHHECDHYRKAQVRLETERRSEPIHSRKAVRDAGGRNGEHEREHAGGTEAGGSVHRRFRNDIDQLHECLP